MFAQAENTFIQVLKHTSLRAVHYYQCLQSQQLFTLTYRENVQNIFHTRRIVENLVAMVMYNLYILSFLLWSNNAP